MSQDKQELLKAVSKILDEALLTYEEIEKSEEVKKFDHEPVQDPTKIQAEAAPVDEPKKDEPESKEESEEEKKKREEEEAKEKKDEPKDEENDEKLMETYKSVCSKMEKRGLIKSEVKTEEVKKSESVEKAEIETLKKSFSDQVSELKGQMDALTKAVEKFAKTPAAPRKGLSGATPLRKSGDGDDKPVLSKEGALNKLLSLKKNGDDRVDTGLINRVETGRLNKNDYERLNSILG